MQLIIDLMKIYNTLSDLFKRFFIFLFFAFLAIVFQAQNVYNSPYSRFGIGDLKAIQNPRNAAMGGISIGLTGLNNVSNSNPASYINLDSMAVSFDVSLHATFSSLSEKADGNTLSTNTNNSSLGQLSLAFPITSWIKAGFGLKPASGMGYDVMQEGLQNQGMEYSRQHIGQGGLNQVFVGFAIGTNRISVGANLNYHFGSFYRQINESFTEDDSLIVAPSMTQYRKDLDASGTSIEFGIQYRQPLSKNYLLGLGVTYTPSHTLNASRKVLLLSMFNTSVVDSILKGETEEGTLKMPAQYAVGLSFEKLNRWVIGAEYTVVNFEKYQEFSEHDANLRNAQNIRLGAELKGQPMGNNFFGRISYRLGYHHGTNYVAFQESPIKQTGISIGFGIPIRRTHSGIDIAVEIGRKGNLDKGQIQESYARITVGISAFERWFMREKFE